METQDKRYTVEESQRLMIKCKVVYKHRKSEKRISLRLSWALREFLYTETLAIFNMSTDHCNNL